MPSRSSYLLIIAGRLRGDQIRSAIVQDIQAAFRKPEKEPKKKEYVGGPATDAELTRAEEDPTVKLGAGWPEGFVLRNYAVCDWRAEAERYGQHETQFTFRAEIHHSRPGPLFDNRRDMLPEVGWFYNYRLYKWHADLVGRLRTLNEKLAAENLLIAPIWFCIYQWYCGNSGP